MQVPPPSASVDEVETPSGTARVTLHRPTDPVGLVLLGHGAGGGIEAPDLRRLNQALTASGVAVGLVEQPYRVAGRRMAARTPVLDAAMLALAEASRRDGEPLVLGGRSSGARVACRTARAAGAVGVLALAFPLHPPWKPESSRLPELLGAGVPALVVQGERDRFGGAGTLAAELAVAADAMADADAHADDHAEAVADITLLPVPGADHALDRAFDVDAVVGWVLGRLDGAPARG